MSEQINDATPAVRRPDAVKIPMNHPVRPGFKGRKFDFLFDEAERVLGADRTRGESAGRRSQINENVYFFSLDHSASLLFPTGHRLDGQRRYHWVEQPDKMIFGYLTDAARADLETA